MNNAKQTNKSNVQGDTGTMDEQKKLLIGGGIGIFVVLMLIIYMFSGGGGSSDTKKENTPPKEKQEVSTVHEGEKSKTSPKSSTKEMKVVRAEWGSYIGGTVAQGAIVYVTVVLCFMIYQAVTNIGEVMGIIRRKFWSDLCHGFIYSFGFSNSSTSNGAAATLALAGILISICLVLVVDAIAHLAGYDGYSVSAAYAFLPVYCVGITCYDMIYTKCKCSKRNRKGSKK